MVGSLALQQPATAYVFIAGSVAAAAGLRRPARGAEVMPMTPAAALSDSVTRAGAALDRRSQSLVRLAGNRSFLVPMV